MDAPTKNQIIIITVAAIAVLLLAFFAPISETKGVHIVSSVASSQGAVENNTEMELVKVQGSFVNDGDITAKNLTAYVEFIDSANDKTVKKAVVEGLDVLPNKEHVVEFDSEYLRNKTIPKTSVEISLQFDYVENGQLKTMK